MQNNTSWTPGPEDNLLGLTDSDKINEHEAAGLVKAELYIFELDTDVPISTTLILEIHQIAFEELYSWAGKWRDVDVVVGQFHPPHPTQVRNSMYQYIDNLNFKISIATTRLLQIECLVYAHYEFIRIHPFNNGNGRTGRIIMNLVALKLGFQPMDLYHREGESRTIYINSMREADNGNFEPLTALISEELTAF